MSGAAPSWLVAPARRSRTSMRARALRGLPHDPESL